MSDGPEPDVSHIIHLARIEHNIQKKEGKRETGFLFRQADRESYIFHRIISLDPGLAFNAKYTVNLPH